MSNIIGLFEVFIAFIFVLVFQCFLLCKKSLGGTFLKSWPFLGMLPGMLFNIPCFFDWIVEVHEANDMTFAFKGPWFSGTDKLFTVDPRNISHMLSSNFSKSKGPEFKKIFDILGDGIVTADMELWEDLRKSGHSLFHHQNFLKLSVSSTTSKLNDDLVPFLDKAAEENNVIDLQDVFQRFMFDTASILMTGYDPMSLSTEIPGYEFGEAADFAEEAIFYRHLKPVILWRLQNLIGVGIERKIRTASEIFNSMFSMIISSRRKEEISRGEKEPAINAVTYYMNVDTTKYKLLKPGNDTFIRDVVLSLLIAGRDTTSSALTWFFWLLSKHPQVLTKIRHEINTNFDPTDLETLVYLHAALFESMRLYPPVPFNHKSPSKSDVLPSGHKVEADSKIVICIYALGRMRSVWGEDASEFKPERWISENGGLKREPSSKFLVFNAGPRTCLGKHLALLQMKMVSVEIIQNYNFKVVEGQKIEPVPSIILRMKNGIKVTVSKNI
ncbi:Alkane hydroxylase MAH1 [Raphanus sativus]|uniref:Alkane hydroxylase MAH1 n=1 Tax=Raphanus sativus TaxID=3726 RepID=A0A6J0L4Y1_RAPSA|nr:alkane hydroxylase MAH1 [Raphanus sativus]KAJ4878372.1 Alkane hydroxylase MAH1 [Raphanus sativus]